MQAERARGSTNLLIASIDPRVIDGAGGNRGYEDNSNENDNISCELDKGIDIDALIGDGHKKRRTSARVVHINFSKEKNSVQLEKYQKRKVDCGGHVFVVTPIHSSSIASLPTIAHASSQITCS